MERKSDRRISPAEDAVRETETETETEIATRTDAGDRRAEARAVVMRRAMAPAAPAWRMGAASGAADAPAAAERVVDGPARRAEARAAAALAEAEGEPAPTSWWRAHFSLAARARSFGFALEGVRHLIVTQPNAWIHSAATASVVGLGLAFGLDRLEWAAIALAVALVWFAEAMNTAFEHLCDVVEPEFHPAVKRAKDVAAGAVLLASGCAAVTGLLVFAPYFWALVGG